MVEQTPNTNAAEEERSRIEQIVATKAYVDNLELIPWYKKEVGELKPGIRDLFEKYSKIPSADVEEHVKHVRDEAFKILPYPCLGNCNFLSLSIGEGSAYQEIVKRIKDGEQFLDLGCCMGQDVRKLVSDGVPSENTFASDLKKDFWDSGYDMFRDKSSLKTTFLEADIFDADSPLKQLDGKIDIINTASFFHLFDLDEQIKVAKRIVQLLRPVPNSLLVGRQGGLPNAGSFSHVLKRSGPFWHNAESWKDMWEKVGRETGTEWHVEAELSKEQLPGSARISMVPAEARRLTFTIRRV